MLFGEISSGKFYTFVLSLVEGDQKHLLPSY